MMHVLSSLSDRLLAALADHAGLVVGTSAASVGTLGMAVGAVPVPAGIPPWIAALLTALAPFFAVLGVRLLAAFAAGRLAKAAARRRRAAELKADKDPGNDKEADKLLEEAESLEAQAKAAEAFAARR